MKLLNKTSLLSGALGVILSTCWHIRRLFQYGHKGNLSSVSTALPSNWRCITATGPVFWRTLLSWNLHITESFRRCRLLQTDSRICCTDVNVFMITNHSVGKHIQPGTQQTSSDYILSWDNLWLSVHYFEKGTCPLHHKHNIPLTAVAPFTLPVQNQRAHRVPLLITGAAPFSSQPLFQLFKIARYDGLSRYSANRPYIPLQLSTTAPMYILFPLGRLSLLPQQPQTKIMLPQRFLHGKAISY